MLGSASSQADVELLSGLLEISLPSCTACPDPLWWQGKELAIGKLLAARMGVTQRRSWGKTHTLLSPEMPKSGPSSAQRIKDWQFRFSLDCTSNGIELEASGGGGGIVSAHSGLLPRSHPLWLAQHNSCSKLFLQEVLYLRPWAKPWSILRWEQATCLLKAAPGKQEGEEDGMQSWPSYK